MGINRQINSLNTEASISKYMGRVWPMHTKTKKEKRFYTELFGEKPKPAEDHNYEEEPHHRFSLYQV